MSSRTFSFRIFRVALLFICQGTSNAGFCMKRFPETCLRENAFMQKTIVRQHSVSSFAANWLCNKLSLSHVCFASSAINGDHQRRRRDLNPRAAINDLLPFQGSPFSRLGTSPMLNSYSCIKLNSVVKTETEKVGFEPTAPFGVTGFQDRLLKPLGHLSKDCLNSISSPSPPCQA